MDTIASSRPVLTVAEDGTLVVSEGTVYLWRSDFQDAEQRSNVHIRKIIFPHSLKYLDIFSITGLSELDTVVFSTCGLTRIPSGCFYGCHSLRTVVLPEGVTEIEDSAFEESGIISIQLPKSLETIGPRAFSQCESLTHIVVPAGVDEIGENAFIYCSSLTSVSLPDSVRSIGAHAFERCKALRYINFPKELVSLGEQAFFEDAELREARLPDGLTVIPSSCFAGCRQLSEVTLPASLKRICSLAFSKCQIQDIEFPDGLEMIGSSAFSHTQLKAVSFPASVRDVAPLAFAYCRELEHISFPESLSRIGGGAFYKCVKLQSVKLPKGLRFVEPDAFAGCSLKTVVLPESVMRVGKEAFACDCGTYLIADPDSKYYSSLDGCLLSKAGSGRTLVHAFVCNGVLRLPDTVEYIDGDELPLQSVTELILPDGFTDIRGINLKPPNNKLQILRIEGTCTDLIDVLMDAVKHSWLSPDFALIADNWCFAENPLPVRRMLLRGFCLRLERGEAIPDCTAEVCRKAAQRSAQRLWREPICRSGLLAGGLLTADFVCQLLDEAYAAGDVDMVSTLIAYRSKWFTKQTAAAAERRHAMKARGVG